MLRQTIDCKRFAEKLCELCYAGDVAAMRLLLSYTDGLPTGRADVEDTQGIQITVTYVQQNNRVEFTSVTSGAGQGDPAGEAVQCRELRPTLRQDGPGDGSIDTRGSGR